MPKLKEIIGEQAYNALPDDKKKDYENVDLVNSAEYVSKKDYDTSQETAQKYKKDLDKVDKDLKDIQEKVKDNEELTKEIETLRTNKKKDKEDYEAKLKQITFDSKLEKKLGDYNPHNVEILKKALDIKKISLDGDNFLGLDEQIKDLNETDKYLFKETAKEDKTKGTGIIGSDNHSADDKGSSSIGALLAKAKTENKNVEAQNKFFA